MLRWQDRASILQRSDDEKELDLALDEDVFPFKEGEKAFLDQVKLLKGAPSVDYDKHRFMKRKVAEETGSKRRREILAAPRLSEEEKKDRIFKEYRYASEDSSFHPKQLNVGPRNLRFLAELAVEHKRSLNYVLDRIVEAARYNLPWVISAETAVSDRARLMIKQKKLLEGLAAKLLREEINEGDKCQPPSPKSESSSTQDLDLT